MIDFGLSDDQEALQRSAREFLGAECPPALVRDAATSDDGVPRELYRKMAELGWMSLLVPEKQGGLGLGTLELALVCEELGRVAAPGPFLTTQLVIAALLQAGTAAQRATWLPKLMAGEAHATLAYLEESDRHDAAGVQLKATKSRTGWTLSGTKLFVPEAQGADLLLVAARTKAGATGVSLFLVEPAAKGVRVKAQQGVDVTRKLGEVVLKNVVVPKDALVGTEHQGWPVLARLIDLAAVGIAADSLGGAQRTLEMAVEYAKVREQFGRKIGSFQAVKHIAAEMVADVEPQRSLVWYAAYAYDHRPKDAARAAAMAKASLGDVYSRTARRSVEIHGGIGFTWEFDLQLWYKRAHANEIAYGDPSFHRERVAELDGY
ncbi:MAG TPA: acyl-CoA dehydrogenase family protein [Candidatus Binatia bacterium]|jgi:alkylation response protein AidB-like acyl-CoA dehydrogenase|nr:acyl-CoA dehydrogenase family protein [Candidatus Binatia bacterium]